MQEEADSDLMHVKGLGKGERFSNETAEALAKRVVETLHVIRGAFGVSGPMLSGGQDVVVAFEVIRVKPTLAVRERDARPQQAGSGVIARTQRVGHDLASASAQGQPKPDHTASAMANEAPQFIQFQHVLGLGRSQGGLQRRQILGFF